MAKRKEHKIRKNIGKGKETIDNYLPFPIKKGHESFCPICDVKLDVTGWEDHTTPTFPVTVFGSRKVGSEGWGLKCPKCGKTFYDAVRYFD